MGCSINSDGGISINLVFCDMNYATIGGSNSPMDTPLIYMIKFK